MVPKQFPFPIGIGTDICQISRVRHIAADVTHLNSWARKVFTRHEWPTLYHKIASGGTEARAHDFAKLNLPPINVADQAVGLSTPQNQLSHFLAGRWAAKEAMIKAHRHTKPFMSRISILTEKKPPSKRIYALVDPLTQNVVMNEDVARKRGLRGYGKNGVKDYYAGHCIYGDFRNGDFVEAEPPNGQKFLARRRKVKAEERQMAEVSISHDGDYAVAVCMAFDEPSKHAEKQPMIVDDGSGSPIHEPEWADVGWLTKTDSDLD